MYFINILTSFEMRRTVDRPAVLTE